MNNTVWVDEGHYDRATLAKALMDEKERGITISMNPRKTTTPNTFAHVYGKGTSFPPAFDNLAEMAKGASSKCSIYSAMILASLEPVSYIEYDVLTDLVRHTTSKECLGNFDKVKKGKHTYPHWYKR